MHVLVTGASGFVGSHLVNALLDHGDNVVCLARKSSHITNHRVKWIYSIDALEHYDTVYHLAGVLGQTGVPLVEYSLAHVRMAYEILKQMDGKQHFIYMSSAWVNIVDKPYELTKYDGEFVVKASKIPYTIVRPGFIYGGGDMHHLKIFQMIQKLGQFTPIIGSGHNRICPTYVNDVVKALINCGLGELNIAGNPLTVRYFMDCVADAVGVSHSKLTLACVPDMFKEVVKWDFFTKERVFKSDVVTTDLKTGLEQTVRWYKDNGYLK